MPASTQQVNSCLIQSPIDKSSKGFTLLELLIVVAIVGTLAAIAIPAYSNYVNTAKITLAHGALDTMRKTLESFQIDYQQYPADIDFITGKDDMGRTVIQIALLEKIKNDLYSLDSYDSDTRTYTMVVKAKDSNQTIMTLTPQFISY